MTAPAWIAPIGPGQLTLSGRLPADAATAARVTEATKVGTDFEAAMLTPMVEALLPDDDAAIWGGSAGKLWRGVFAESVARAIAEGGGIGVGALVVERLDAVPDAPTALPTVAATTADEETAR